jgi:hypothetical protein
MFAKLLFMSSAVLYVCSVFAAARIGASPKTVISLSSVASGGGSACLAGCDECDRCLSDQRWQQWYPHFECRFA